MVIIACPNCGHTTRIEESLLGKKGRCKRCAHVFRAEATPRLERNSADPSTVAGAAPPVLAATAHASSDIPNDVREPDVARNEFDRESLAIEALFASDLQEPSSSVQNEAEPELMPDEPELALLSDEELVIQEAPNDRTEPVEEDFALWLNEASGDSTAITESAPLPGDAVAAATPSLPEEEGDEPNLTLEPAVGEEANLLSESVVDWLSDPPAVTVESDDLQDVEQDLVLFPESDPSDIILPLPTDAEQESLPQASETPQASSMEPLLSLQEEPAGSNDVAVPTDQAEMSDDDLLSLLDAPPTPPASPSSSPEPLWELDFETNDAGEAVPSPELAATEAMEEEPMTEVLPIGVEPLLLAEELSPERDPGSSVGDEPRYLAEEPALMADDEPLLMPEDPLLIPEAAAESFEDVEPPLVPTMDLASSSAVEHGDLIGNAESGLLLLEESMLQPDEPLQEPEEPLLVPEAEETTTEEPILVPIVESALIPDDEIQPHTAPPMTPSAAATELSMPVAVDRPIRRHADLSIAAIEAIRVRLPVNGDVPSEMGCRVFVKVVGVNGHVGWGEAVPSDDGGGSILSLCLEMAAIVREEVAPAILRTSAWSFTTKMDRLLGGYPSVARRQALAAVDMAVCDLVARSLEISLVDLLGGGIVQEMPLAFVEDCKDEDGTVDRACRSVDGGRSVVLLRPVRMDAAKLAAMARAVVDSLPSSVSVVVDCNRQYSTDVAMRLLDECSDAGVRCVWEPLVPSPVATFANLVRNRKSPIALAVSLDGATRFLEYAAASSLDQVVVDPGRLGGLHRAVFLGRLAQSAGLGLVGSCGWQSDLGLAHSLAVFAHLGIRTFVDAPGVGRLVASYGRGLVVKPGAICLPDGVGCGVGCGVEVDEATLRAYS